MFLLVPAHPGCPEQSPESHKMVEVVVVGIVILSYPYYSHFCKALLCHVDHSATLSFKSVSVITSVFRLHAVRWKH